MIGLVDRERVDEELYDDYETVKAREVSALFISIFVIFIFLFLEYVAIEESARYELLVTDSFLFSYNRPFFILSPALQKRLAKEARAQEIQAKNATTGKKVKEPVALKGMKGRGEASFYRVTCKV